MVKRRIVIGLALISVAFLAVIRMNIVGFTQQVLIDEESLENPVPAVRMPDEYHSFTLTDGRIFHLYEEKVPLSFRDSEIDILFSDEAKYDPASGFVDVVPVGEGDFEIYGEAPIDLIHLPPEPKIVIPVRTEMVDYSFKYKIGVAHECSEVCRKRNSDPFSELIILSRGDRPYNGK